MPNVFRFLLAAAALPLVNPSAPAADAPPKVPRFSVDYLDRSVPPGTDFFQFAAGTWIKSNPVPADKSRWGAFMELSERNWYLIHQILDTTLEADLAPGSPAAKVRDFYRSAMETNRLEELAFKPLQPDLDRIDAISSAEEMLKVLAEFHQRGIGVCFRGGVAPDEKDSSVYSVYLAQGGLTLPDRDYYLQDSFSKIRDAYVVHIAKLLALAGEDKASASAHAATILELETSLAKASKSRTDLRDPVANYHKVAMSELLQQFPGSPLTVYFSALGLENLKDVNVRQPEFFQRLYAMGNEVSLEDWKVYLRWHLINSSAPYLHAAAEAASFDFFGRTLRGQQQPEPRWQRSAHVIDGGIGEALGEMFVARHFPPEARARMLELVGNVKAVFLDRLQHVDWMTEATRAKALAKFDRFTQKIGHPDKYRDYTGLDLSPSDFLGNVRRANVFESKRELALVGKAVDKTEWHMTPQTVNAYFSPSLNEIVFPAGILQPPFFDTTMDDAVNYGAIGVVIGHEITHGYDDEGRKYDADGNLNDWWTEADTKAFDARAQKVVDQYNSYEALPGLHVNGKLTLGENIADLGGTSVAYEALERALAKDPAKRKKIDGFTPEQRFFLSLAQLWRINCREAEIRRLVTTDPHSPGQFRGIGPHVNTPEFYQAFDIKEGMPMWRAPGLRAKIW